MCQFMCTNCTYKKKRILHSASAIFVSALSPIVFKEHGYTHNDDKNLAPSNIGISEQSVRDSIVK